ncbi:MAG: hypothetical protein L0229_16055 [Blastocatellia bacterium]|nr:hypothetical protein [Blastocatellia bacterium]
MYCSFLLERPSRLFTKSLSLFTIILILASASIPARAQGFGRWKMDVDLYRYIAPKILLEGTDIQVHVTTQRGLSRNFLEQMKQSLEIGLPRADRRLKAVSYKAETVIICDITDLSSSSRTDTRYASVYRKVGEHTVFDETTQMNRTVEDFGYVNEPYTATIVDGFLSVFYECIDVKTGDVIDSDTITSDYNQEHAYPQVPSPGAAEYAMIGNAVSYITARFSPRAEFFNLLLPKGRLKGASQLIQKRMWNSALEKLSAIREFKDPEKDAFRVYDIAISYQGLSNYAPDPDSSRHYLEKAVSYYKEAVRKNPLEDRFRRAELMAEASLTDHRKLEAAMRDYESKKQKAAAVAGAQTTGQTPAGKPAAQPVGAQYVDPSIITNDTVIGWVRAGVSEKKIRSRINQAERTSFDLSSGDVSNLLASGVSARTIDEMRNFGRNRQPRGKWGDRLTLILLYTMAVVRYITPYVFRTCQ